jgi:hypothetical protein
MVPTCCCRLSLLILLAFPVRASIFVANRQGCSDSGAGTQVEPLCTITAALAQSRASGDKDVVLRAGRWMLASTLRLTGADSGLTLRAFNRERPVLSGGMVVHSDTWTQSNTTLGIWHAPIPASCQCTGPPGGACGPSSCMAYSSPRQMYVGGLRANRTSANASLLLGGMRLGGSAAAPPPQSPRGVLLNPSSPAAYIVTKPALKGWGPTKQAAEPTLAGTDMEFVYTAQIEPWTEPRCGIRHISADGLTLRMQDCLHQLPIKPGCASGPTANKTLCPRRWFMSGLPGTIENALELLTPERPGEFYVDRANALVYYVPHANENLQTLEVILPLLETLLDSDGAKGLTIRGLEFLHTAWGGADRPCGYVPIQSGWSPRPLTEPKSLGPMLPPPPLPPQTAEVGVKRSFVIGAGGDFACLDSAAPGPSRLVSSSNTAVLNMQGDANLCLTLYTDASHSKVSTRGCIGAPVCPCAPMCKGKQKLPPYCNRTSPAGYRLVVKGGNLCVEDNAANTSRWCALKEPLKGGGESFMMLADDGSICLHAGSYNASSPATSTVWCQVAGGQADHRVHKQVPGGVRIRNTSCSSITLNKFAHMGGAGLDVFAGSQHTEVSGNYLHDISGTAIQVKLCVGFSSLAHTLPICAYSVVRCICKLNRGVTARWAVWWHRSMPCLPTRALPVRGERTRLQEIFWDCLPRSSALSLSGLQPHIQR